MVDAELVAQALAGDAAGIAGIYDRYSDRIHDYARSMLRNDADAADVTQDTFLVGAQRLSQLRDATKLRPWLYAIARSHALRVLRTRNRVESSDDVDSVVEMTSTEGAIDAQRLVRAAADGLEDSDRDILDLHLRHGLEGQELADALGISANAANVALHRVRERFEQAATTVLLSAAPAGECEEFDQLVASGLSPLVRKRVARHIDGCAVCQERKKSTRPFSVFAAIPLAAAPSGLRDQVLVAVGTSQGFAAASQLDWGPDGFPTATPPAAAPDLEASRASKANVPSASSAPRLAFAGVGIAAALLLTFFLFRSGRETTVELTSEAEITAVAAPVFEPTPTPEPEPAPTANPQSPSTAPTTTTVPPTATAVPPTAEPPASSAPPPVVSPPTPTPTPVTPTPTPVTPTPTPTPVTPTPTPVTPTPTPVTPTPTPVVEVPVITPISYSCTSSVSVAVDVEATGPFTVVLEWTSDSASGSVTMQWHELIGYYRGAVDVPDNETVTVRVVATNDAGPTIYDDYFECPRVD